MNSLALAQKLISFNTITPNEGGSVEYLEKLLQSLGFSVVIKQFEDIDKASQPTWNIYAYTSKNPAKNLTFIGHMDVVHPGHDSDWTHPPFEPTIDNNTLYGRGASDMKVAIACFIVALGKYIGENSLNKTEIEADTGKVKASNEHGFSMLLTYDEEGNAINGTKKMLHYLHNEGFTFSHAITGEPTCSQILGDTIKVGRRGSVNFAVEIIGKQGHAAYPELANNPMYTAVQIISALKQYRFDEGSEFFQATNLEITGVGSSTQETNVIPNSVRFLCNVRFNNLHNAKTIEKIVTDIIQNNSSGMVYKIEVKVSGESFLIQDLTLANTMRNAIKTVTGIEAQFSTTGGTSDARFMKDYASIIEFGVLNKNAHKIDEHVQVADITTLEQVYSQFIHLWSAY